MAKRIVTAPVAPMQQPVAPVAPVAPAPIVVVATGKAVLLDSTRIGPNPLGVGRTVPNLCVGQALAAIGTGCTVAEYRERMHNWYASHPAPHMAYPGHKASGDRCDNGAMAVLRRCVDVTRKVVLLPELPAPVAPVEPAAEPAAKAAKAAKRARKGRK